MFSIDGAPDSARRTDQLTLIARSVEAAGRSWAIAQAEEGRLRFVRVNSAFEDMVQMTRAEVVGRFDDVMFGPRTSKEDVSTLRDAVRTSRPITVTLAMYRANGGQFVCEVSAAPIASEDGDSFFVLIYADVTAAARAQSELKKAWETERMERISHQNTALRLRAVLGQMPSGVVLAEASSGRVIGSNQQASRMLGSLSDLSLLDDSVEVSVCHPNGARYLANQLPLARALSSGKPTEPEDCQFIVNLNDSASHAAREGHAVMQAAPITDDNGTIVAGILLIDDITTRRAAEIELEASRHRAAELAMSLQKSLLPSKFPTVEFASFGSEFSPAGEGLEVGGDFYDVFEQRDGDLVAVIGDVMGKGVEAAAVTSLVRHVIRTTALRSRRVSTLLQMLNEALCKEEGNTPFATVAAALFVPDEVTRTVEMTVSLAGHAQPLIVRSGGTVHRVGRPGTLVGVMEEIEVGEDRTTLAAGDSVVFFTDGVTEARNSKGAFFGEEGLIETLGFLEEAQRKDPQAIASAVVERVRHFGSGDSADDIAVMVVRINDSFSH